MAPAKRVNSVDDFILALGLLIRRVRSDAPEVTKSFSWTHKAVLSRLANEGPTTSADLARAEGVKPQSMGVVVSSLEEMELVERKPHPTDGRQMLVKLTSKGVLLRKSVATAKHTWIASEFSKLAKHEQSILFQAADIIQTMVEPK